MDESTIDEIMATDNPVKFRTMINNFLDRNDDTLIYHLIDEIMATDKTVRIRIIFNNFLDRNDDTLIYYLIDGINHKKILLNELLDNAVRVGKVNIILHLMEMGAKDEHLLEKAVVVNNIAVAKVLLDHQIQITESTIETVIETGNHQFIDLFVQYGTAPERFFRAILYEILPKKKIEWDGDMYQNPHFILMQKLVTYGIDFSQCITEYFHASSIKS